MGIGYGEGADTLLIVKDKKFLFLKGRFFAMDVPNGGERTSPSPASSDFYDRRLEVAY